MGGPNDYKSWDAAYFTSMGAALNFFKDNDILYDWDGKERHLDFGLSMYRKGDQGIGRLDFTLLPLEKGGVVINPNTVQEVIKGRG